jgi:hypothetical protein
MKSKKHKMEIKTSGDFANDPEGAVDALDKTGFAIFMINEKWFDDHRAIMEWRYAKDIGKPLLYIFRDNEIIVKNPLLAEMMAAPSLMGTINDYGDTEKTGTFVQAIIAAFCKVNDVEI